MLKTLIHEIIPFVLFVIMFVLIFYCLEEQNPVEWNHKRLCNYCRKQK